MYILYIITIRIFCIPSLKVFCGNKNHFFSSKYYMNHSYFCKLLFYWLFENVEVSKLEFK